MYSIPEMKSAEIGLRNALAREYSAKTQDDLLAQLCGVKMRKMCAMIDAGLDITDDMKELDRLLMAVFMKG